MAVTHRQTQELRPVPGADLLQPRVIRTVVHHQHRQMVHIDQPVQSEVDVRRAAERAQHHADPRLAGIERAGFRETLPLRRLRETLPQQREKRRSRRVMVTEEPFARQPGDVDRFTLTGRFTSVIGTASGTP